MGTKQRTIHKHKHQRTNKRKHTHKHTRKIYPWDQPSVWGKNPSLERFWKLLASGKKGVAIYKNRSHAFISLPEENTDKYHALVNNPNIIAILTSNPSQDAYEVYLYPKAKDKSVSDVIQHYPLYFHKEPSMGKLMFPY